MLHNTKSRNIKSLKTSPTPGKECQIKKLGPRAVLKKIYVVFLRYSKLCRKYEKNSKLTFRVMSTNVILYPYGKTKGGLGPICYRFGWGVTLNVNFFGHF